MYNSFISLPTFNLVIKHSVYTHTRTHARTHAHTHTHTHTHTPYEANSVGPCSCSFMLQHATPTFSISPSLMCDRYETTGVLGLRVMMGFCKETLHHSMNTTIDHASLHLSALFLEIFLFLSSLSDGHIW